MCVAPRLLSSTSSAQCDSFGSFRVQYAAPDDHARCGARYAGSHGGPAPFVRRGNDPQEEHGESLRGWRRRCVRVGTCLARVAARACPCGGSCGGTCRVGNACVSCVAVGGVYPHVLLARSRSPRQPPSARCPPDSREAALVPAPGCRCQQRGPDLAAVRTYRVGVRRDVVACCRGAPLSLTRPHTISRTLPRAHEQPRSVRQGRCWRMGRRGHALHPAGRQDDLRHDVEPEQAPWHVNCGREALPEARRARVMGPHRNERCVETTCAHHKRGSAAVRCGCLFVGSWTGTVACGRGAHVRARRLRLSTRARARARDDCACMHAAVRALKHIVCLQTHVYVYDDAGPYVCAPALASTSCRASNR